MDYVHTTSSNNVISHKSTIGVNDFGTMRVSQQTGHLYFCNCNSMYGTLEFHRAKVSTIPFQQESMFHVQMGDGKAQKCLDIYFKPNLTSFGVPSEPVVYFTAFHNTG